jgi:hypothetical protein
MHEERKKEKVKKNHKNAISTLSTPRGWNSECPSFLFSFYELLMLMIYVVLF